MTPKTPLDLIHARMEGRITPAEARVLELALAADPDLAQLAEDYRLVHGLTAEGQRLPGGKLMGPLTSYDDLLPRLEPRPDASRPLMRRVAAAAGILLLAGASFVAGWSARRAPRPIELNAIELNPSPYRGQGSATTPLAWAAFDPRGADGVSFLSDLDQAESLARCARRPLLVYGAYPGCPLAAALDEHVFSDPRVVELAERTVPIRIDLSRLPDVEQRALIARGYPFLEMWRADGRPTHSLVRAPDAERFVESLYDGLERSEAVGELPAWEEIHDRAQRYEIARQSELAGELQVAESGYRLLVQDPQTPAELSRRSAEGLERLALDARERLLEARRIADEQPGRALEILDTACLRFAGTTWLGDLEAVRARLRRDGRFPLLAEFDRSV